MTKQGSSGSTGTKDKDYNLISVLYHALQGAETVGMYMQDAKDDKELSQYFSEVQSQYRQLADRAKTLLGKRFGSGGK